MTFFVCLYSMLFCDARLCNVMVQLIHWVISLFGLVISLMGTLLYSQATKSKCPQIFIIIILKVVKENGVMQTNRLADV